MFCFLLFTGVGSLIGLRSGKVLAYNTRTQRCATCEAASRNGYPSRKHDCWLNWTGSSKAMELDVAAELAVYASEHGAPVAVLVGDNDSCTCQEGQGMCESWRHKVVWYSACQKIVCNKSLCTSEEPQRNSEWQSYKLLVDVFWVCIVSKQGQCSMLAEKPEGNNWATIIVAHAFGKHDNCRAASASWCGFLQDPHTYKHKSLPHGKDLQDENLQKDLSTVVEIFVKNADKLAPLGSSQAKESLNNSVGSKAPKIHHYGASESNDYRVACAVGQKNIGYSYVSEVCGNYREFFFSHFERSTL